MDGFHVCHRCGKGIVGLFAWAWTRPRRRKDGFIEVRHLRAGQIFTVRADGFQAHHIQCIPPEVYKRFGAWQVAPAPAGHKSSFGPSNRARSDGFRWDSLEIAMDMNSPDRT